jgi:hypothetical protein
MKENFLHYLWRYGLYDQEDLRTTGGEPVHVEDPGYPHQDGGPDFQNARVRIGPTLWAGNVEIHFRSSQWYEHGHHRDPAYKNVILHVVLQADRATIDPTGRSLETLELKQRIPDGLAFSYQRFMNAPKEQLPCEGMISEVPDIVIKEQLDRSAFERLERKGERIQRLWDLSGKDPRESFYRLLGRYFGGRVNATPFEQLMLRTPLRTLLRERDRLGGLEALLFGQAGFLEHEFRDRYPLRLKEEYRYLQSKYALRAMDPSGWRFLRLRPPDHPPVRIAQFAALIHSIGDPWNAFLKVVKGRSDMAIFQVEASSYWKDHHKFEKEREKKSPARVGKGMTRRLLINACIPFLFFYGKKVGDDASRERALELLEGLKPEEDRIQRKWKALGVFPDNASRSQGAIELMEAFCEPRKCLSCKIGDRILKKRAQ